MTTRDTPTILLVDDEPDTRTVARLSLQQLGGFAVIEASSGAEALEAAARHPPALILLDVMMPGMDGTELFRALAEHPSTRALPVVFLTAKAMPGELERLRAMGARAILTKPFDPAALVGLVRQVLAAEGRDGPNCSPAPTAPRTDQQPVADIDTEALRSLWGLAGESGDLLGELIDLFAANTPNVIGSLRTHAASSVPKEAERAAHSLKSSALTLGARDIAQLARTIETAAREGRTDEIAALADRIDALLQPAVARLRAERARLLAGI